MPYTENIEQFLKNLKLDEPKHLVKALNTCGSELGLWGLNDLSDKEIRRFISKRSREAAYIGFDIKKKAGGSRHITAPVESLKEIQQALNLFLQTVCEVSPAAMGFVPGRSIVTNAEVHVGSSVIFNCDLKDFFPSITKSMVRRTLASELSPLNPVREVINRICSLVTTPRPDGVEALPQGAPTSPVVSNLVMKQLDRRLMGFAEKNGYRYTRYADDITFSRTGPYFSRVPIKSEAIIAIIEDCGFTINPKKTVIQTQSSRREVTGLKVSDKVNVSRKYIKQLRMMLHLWETRGYYETQMIVGCKFRHGSDADFTKIINGKINYLCMVKGREDPTYRRFKYRYRKLMHELKNDNKATEEELLQIIESGTDIMEDSCINDNIIALLPDYGNHCLTPTNPMMVV